jgi:signal peptidase I
MSWKITQEINWVMNRPASTAHVYCPDSDREDRQKAEKILNKRVPIKKGDEIVIFSDDNNNNLLCFKWKGKNDDLFGNVLNKIYRFLSTPIVPENPGWVYYKIGRFLRGERRLELVNKFENGTLTPKELMGDHIYFEGMKRAGRSKLIYISRGS